MEGIEEPLALLTETAYTLEAARAVTAAMVSQGAKPAVISGLMKYQCTERMRACLNAAFDIHGGKAICDGPSNYLQAAYQISPVSITVEGANILTRSLIVFAQGALRSHPYLYSEIEAAQNPDREAGFLAFETAFEAHVAFAASNLFGSIFHNVTFGLFANAPKDAAVPGYYRQLYRAATNFALLADLSVALLGGGLKTKQRTTGRLADALSELYFVCCLLKRYEDDGRLAAERPVFDYAVQKAFHGFYAAMHDAIDNFPILTVRPLLKLCVFPLGNHFRKPKDSLAKTVVRAVLEPGEVRDRLTRYIFVSHDEHDQTGLLEVAMKKVVEADEADRKLERAVRQGTVKRYLGNDWIKDAQEKGILSERRGRSSAVYGAPGGEGSSRSTISTPMRSSRTTRRAIMYARCWMPRRRRRRSSPRRRTRRSDAGVIPEMPKALSGNVTNAGQCLRSRIAVNGFRDDGQGALAAE